MQACSHLPRFQPCISRDQCDIEFAGQIIVGCRQQAGDRLKHAGCARGNGYGTSRFRQKTPGLLDRKSGRSQPPRQVQPMFLEILCNRVHAGLPLPEKSGHCHRYSIKRPPQRQRPDAIINNCLHLKYHDRRDPAAAGRLQRRYLNSLLSHKRVGKANLVLLLQ